MDDWADFVAGAILTAGILLVIGLFMGGQYLMAYYYSFEGLPCLRDAACPSGQKCVEHTGGSYGRHESDFYDRICCDVENPMPSCPEDIEYMD